MQLFNFSLALSKPLKEKGYIGKLSVILGLSLVVTLFSGILGLASSSNNDFVSAVAALLGCLTIVVALAASIVGLWYTYEYTQAAMKKRETVELWKMEVGTSLKRVAKLFLVQLVYNIPFILITCCLFVLMASIFGASVGTTIEAVDNRNPDLNALLPIFSGGAIFLCCAFVILVIAFFLYQSFVTLPATLKLIETNTIGEAFKLKRNIAHTRANLGSYAKLLLIQIVIGIMIGLVSLVSAFPVIGLCLALPVVVITTYIQTISWSVLIGDFYRQLKK